MFFLKKLRYFLNRFDLVQDNVHFLEDASKYVMVLSRLLLHFVNLWPMNFTKVRKVFFYATMGIAMGHHFTIFSYTCRNVRSIDNLTEILPAMSLMIELLSKTFVLYGKRDQLKDIIKIVWNDFWPSNTFGKELEEKISTNTKDILIPIILQMAVGSIYSTICIFLPFVATPSFVYHAWYPPGWDRSLFQTILNILRSYLMTYVINSMVCAYDLLYTALCINCISQYLQLSYALKFIGTRKELEVILKIQGKDNKNPSIIQNDEGRVMKLLIICAKHHQMLIRFGNELNTIFGSGHFLQLVATLIGICTTSYNISQKTGHMVVMLSCGYYLAYFWQLYVYCASSNSLSVWSTYVSDAAFDSEWHASNTRDIRKCLSIIMIRSQRPVIMNAFGLFQLNYESLLTVMRFSFSLYTFLRKIAA
uniref:Odorant receptor n=1 Tax=Protaetia brevitarsis TaxID=348688 RepID=A0A411HR33_PROBE|nr:odorant receptor [Protaetia brevitarsis]